MKVAFFSNYLNHHQLSFCKVMMNKCEFTFVATEKISQERVDFGYSDMDKQYPFVLRTYEGKEQVEYAKEIAFESDIVIIGSAPYEYIKNRIRANRITFQYSERINKTPSTILKNIYRLIKYYQTYNLHKSQYLLCSSAYAAADYLKLLSFYKRAYKWGYFPETKKYDIDNLLQKKEKTRILWVGRFLDWKHPDDVLRIAKRLKDAGYSFSIDIGGTGEMGLTLKTMVDEMQLHDYVTFLGTIPSDHVRSYMEKAGIYMFTSDRYEGWGAVLNESMNSGCAVVASHAIGAVPFLIKHNQNGLVYHSGNTDELYEKVKYLLENPVEQSRLGKAAFETIAGEWNAEVAAERLVNLSEHLLAGEKHPDLYQTGPCSKADIIQDDWF